MKKYFLFNISFFFLVNYSVATLVDSIVTLSWSSGGSVPVVDRFLTSDTQIQLKIHCRQPSLNINENQGKTKGNSNENDATKFQIHGRIGHFTRCLPLQSEAFMTANQLASKDTKDSENTILNLYNELWEEMDQRRFTMQQVDCDYTNELYFDEYTNITKSKISPEKAAEYRKQYLKQARTQAVANQSKINYI